jgi:hypothetical protein
LPLIKSNISYKFKSIGGTVVITETTDPDGHNLTYFYSTDSTGSNKISISKK